MSKLSRIIFAAAFAVGMSFVSFGVTPLDFSKKFKVTLPDEFVGEHVNFPVLVRLSSTTVSGFSYADIEQGGADVLAFDDNGAACPCQFETYNPDGESLLWVKFPIAKAGAFVEIHYGTDQSMEGAPSPTEVWSDYAGVWHLNETTAGATTIVDASGTSDGTSHTSSTATDGVFGGARGLDLDAKNGGMVVVPQTTKLNQLVPSFTVSGWIKPHTLSLNWGYIFSRKTADSYASWGLQFRGSGGNSDSVGIYSSGTSDKEGQYAVVSTMSKWTANVWQKYDVVYTDKTVSLYINGVLVDSVKDVLPGAAVNGENDFAIGGFPTKTNHSTIKADQDEVRLRLGAVSADWIADEYAMQSGTMVPVIDEVEPVDAAAPALQKPTATVDGAGNAIVTITVTAGEGDVYVIYRGDEANKKFLGAIDPNAEYPQIFTDTTKVSLGESVMFAAYAINEAKGLEVRKTADAPMVKPIVAKDFAMRIDFSLSDAAQASIADASAADVPVAVRLSTAIEGFDYADFNTDHTDIAFGIEDDKGILLVFPYDIEVWDPQGESVIWVKLPTFAKTTAFSMFYGNAVLPNEPTEVWSDYVGVWHMTGGSDSEPDATGHGLIGTPTGTKLAEMTSDANAVVGAGRVNQTSSGKYNRLSVPSYNNFIDDHSRFTVSGWFKSTNASGYPRPMSRKSSYDQGTGWEIQYNNGSKTQCDMRGSSGTQVTMDGPDITAGWVYLTYVFDGATGRAYANGVEKKNGTIAAVKSRTEAMAIGNNSNGSEQGWCGSYDEVRMFNGVQTAGRTKADYLAMLATTLVASEATLIDETAVKFAGKPSLSKVAEAFKVSVTAASDSGTGVLKAVYDAADEVEKSIAVSDVVEAGETYAATLTGMTADKSYRVGFFAVNDKATETRAYATNVLYNGTLTIAKGADADEKELATPGTIIVSRGDAYGTLVVNYTVGGTAVGGTHYRELPGTIVIPDGATSATIEIWPIRVKERDTTVEITLTDGLYFLDDAAKSAEITVKKLIAPDGWNTWIANASGLASVAENWSDGVPKAGDKVLFDARYSTADCEWDGGVNGLTDSVAVWKQSADYTGTVTIDTAYDGPFAALNVSGDVEILGGNWTHKANLAADGQKYRLKAIVGGAFTLASGTKLDGEQKGYWGAKCPSGKKVGAHAASGDGYQYVYGNVYKPADLGAGCNDAGSATDIKAGGGAVWIEVAGAMTLDGTVNVRGRQFDGKNSACGSVYVKAASCTGAGTILANFATTGYYNGAQGSGGRVAIELTSATELGLPVANVKINGVCAGANGGGGGTFYLKTADPTKPNGTLYLDDTRSKSYGARWLRWKAITAIPAGETWTFDEIVISNYGRLLVPEGTTLNLPNGPQSVRASSTRLGGIVVNGGTVNWGDRKTFEFSNNWVFQAMRNFVFDGDVIVHSGGALGAMCFMGDANLSDFAGCDITVNGDLTVENGGYIHGAGCGPDISINRNVIYSHGGQAAGAVGNIAYDSIFSPSLPGYGLASGDQATSNPGGGLIILKVTGAFVNNGSVNVSGVKANSTGSAGGSFNLTAATIGGDGTYNADSGSGSSGTAGGGRISIRLTAQDIDKDLLARVSAKGATEVSSGVSSDKSSSAGTVYLQGKGNGEKGGTIYVRNDGNALNTNTYTPIPAGATKAEVAPDSAEDFRNAALVLGDCAQVKLFATTKMNGLTVAANSKLDLNGNTLTVYVAKLGDTKLEHGTYAADNEAVAGFVTDSVGGGSLVVKPAGMKLILR